MTASASPPAAPAVTALFDRQARLRQEADQVMADLGLWSVLGRVGRVELIGSAAVDLMVWRDLDLSIFVDQASADEVGTVLGGLTRNPSVLDLRYANETGARSPSGGTHDQRFYAVLGYRAGTGHVWKIDLSFWTDAGPRGEFLDSAAFRARLTRAHRRAILSIKHEWHRLDSYPDPVGGIHVYDAVLNHGVRHPAEFDDYLRRRGLPCRSAATAMTAG